VHCVGGKKRKKLTATSKEGVQAPGLSTNLLLEEKSLFLKGELLVERTRNFHMSGHTEGGFSRKKEFTSE